MHILDEAQEYLKACDKFAYTTDEIGLVKGLLDWITQSQQEGALTEPIVWKDISLLPVSVLVIGREDGKEFLCRKVPEEALEQAFWYTEVDDMGESVIARHPTEFRYILPQQLIRSKLF